MNELQLDGGVWRVGDEMGDVDPARASIYEAIGPDGRQAVIKRVRNQTGASRELLFGDAVAAAEARNVVPILDQADLGSELVLAMPRAEHSLAQYLRSHDGPLPLDDVLAVLNDVAVALDSLASGIVHRDIKPQNILYLDGHWQLSDFGISRFADATTAPDTRKHMLSAPYAAPEQWLLEHAKPATDVYSLGVVAYEILTGRLPFPGPQSEDYREQHLNQPPPAVPTGPPALQFLIADCLAKALEARPTPAQILNRLARVSTEPRRPGSRLLESANQMALEERARAESEAATRAAEEARLARLAADGIRIFARFSDALLEELTAAAPLAKVTEDEGRGAMLFVARLRGAAFGVSAPQPAQPWSGPFTVAAHATITVNLPRPDAIGWQGRSHSLWFCNAADEDHFAWFETAFCDFVMSPTRRRDIEPRSYDPQTAAPAFQRVFGASPQLAWSLDPLDPDDPQEFVDRWIGWFGAAAAGDLSHPGDMPERDPALVGLWWR